jgi:Lrp/AsnC family leucine-responsive transcriptional regulator/Lrp/AsnC family transcriptional regulator
METFVLDDVDRLILDLLQEDSSITNVELARRVGLAPATTLDRVKKLKQRGIITGHVVLVDAASVGKGTTAFVSVALASHQSDQVAQFRERVAHLPEVLECHHISGEYDYLLKVVSEDIRRYEDFLLDKLAATPNVGKIHTSFVLSTVKHKTKIPIAP